MSDDPNSNRIFSLKKAKKILISLMIIFLFDFFLFPMPTLAAEAVKEADIRDNIANASEMIELDENVTDSSAGAKTVKHLPKNSEKSVKSSGLHVMTSYNSEPGQTDDSPCITANGFNVCKHGIEDTVAANFLPFGTKIKIPDLFGDRVFVVRDRMNARYSDRVDVWMLHKQDALKFGVRTARIEIVVP